VTNIEDMADLDALARNGAVVAPAAGWDTLLVTGPERLGWLEGLLTCELKKLTPGAGTWGLALNRQGKIQSAVWVIAGADELWLALAPGTAIAMQAELGRMLIMEDAELSPPAVPQRWFTLHGPGAAELAAGWALEAGGVSASIDFTGLGGAALVVPETVEPLILGRSEGRLLDANDWARLRLERGLPEFGTDYDGSDRPHEAALDRRAVSWSKGCYLGQEVVCMQDMRGKVRRSVRVLHVDAPAGASLEPGAAIERPGGEAAGSVTSRAYSARAGGWLVMAKLQLEALQGELWYVGAAGRFPARSADLI
jgi:folate-binding protein YgfZ